MRAAAGALAAAALLTAAGCFLWRYDAPPAVAPDRFPPALDAEIDGPLIWAQAYPNWGAAPLTVYFDVELLEEAAIEAWAWDFGDGSPIIRRRLPQHTYERPGTYEVFVWARDRHKRISLDTIKVRVEAQ